MGAGLAAGAGAAAAFGAGAATAARGAPAGGAGVGVGAGRAGAATVGAAAGAPAEATAVAVTAAAGGGAPAGNEGSLIVGEALGFGGKLMRTVSFFGCTLAASAGLGGTAPAGEFGLGSAIKFLLLVEPRVAAEGCQTLIEKGKRAGFHGVSGSVNESVLRLAALAAFTAITPVAPVAAATTRTGWAFFLGTGNVYREGAALEIFAVKHFDGFGGFLRS